MTHEVLDQAIYSQIILDDRATAIRPCPEKQTRERTLTMKKSPPGRPVLPHGRAVVGIDIGKRKHAATALSPQGEVIARLASFRLLRSGHRIGFHYSENKVLGRVMAAVPAAACGRRRRLHPVTLPCGAGCRSFRMVEGRSTI